MDISRSKCWQWRKSRLATPMLVAAMVGFFLGNRAVAQSSIDIYSIDFSYPYRSNDTEQWYAQSYRGLHHVELGAVIGNEVLLFGHNALDLEKRGFLSRLLYLITVGQLDLRFQIANSVVFSHEMAHFGLNIRDGRLLPAFQNLNTSKEDSWLDFYIHMFLHIDSLSGAGAVGGYDASRDISSQDIRRNLPASEGLNQQTWISQRMFQNQLAEGRGVFSAASFLTNRFFTPGYTILGAHLPGGGDIGEMANALAERTGGSYETIKQQIQEYSIGAALLSPATWAYALGIADYVGTADLSVRVPALRVTESIRITYDIPTYTNYDTFTVVPTVYAISDRPFDGVEKMILGLGMETPVIGSGAQEMSAHIRVISGKIDISLDVTAGPDIYFEPELRYSLTDRFDALVGGAFSSGDGTSLRSRRLNQFNVPLFWFGMGYRFR